MSHRSRSLLALITAACLIAMAVAQDDAPGKEADPMSLMLTSSAFQEGQPIPRKYTCDGDDISPPLSWTGVPEDTASLVLICDDPDAPVGTWDHWVLYDLAPDLDGLPEAVPSSGEVPGGGVHGRNGWGRSDYGGPCPPGGTHRYFFKLHALDAKLDLGPGKGKEEVLSAMEGHVLAEAQLMGTYSRG
jgi:Raf kinase inhibitor-like YbhB/YbcL family protein